MTTRDMSKREFDAKCKQYGFQPVGIMGYYHLPVKGCVNVSIYNAVPRTRRAQLAYLLRELKLETEAQP